MKLWCVRYQETLQFGGFGLRQALPAMLQVGPGDVKQQDARAELAGVVDPAGMGAPALGSGDGGDLLLHLRGGERGAEVEIKILQASQLAAQLAGAEVAIVVNDDGGFTGRTTHGPSLVAVMILLMKLKVKLNVAQIKGAGQVAGGRGHVREQAVGVALVEPHKPPVQLSKLFG